MSKKIIGKFSEVKLPKITFLDKVALASIMMFSFFVVLLVVFIFI